MKLTSVIFRLTLSHFSCLLQKKNEKSVQRGGEYASFSNFLSMEFVALKKIFALFLHEIYNFKDWFKNLYRMANDIIYLAKNIYIQIMSK